MQFRKKNKPVVSRVLITLILAIGIVLRLIIYFQNRNLILDEANVARNISERDFAALLQPLDYAQYAPPVFLWTVKLSSLLAGMGEMVLRFYPLACGIMSLFLFSRLLKWFVTTQTVWYPLAIFAVGYLFLRYSTELKQYMPDMLVTIGLLLLTVSIDIQRTKPIRFITIFALAGSIAIWSSMPSVFILSGVVAYYTMICVKHKELKKLLLIWLPTLLWLTQFGLYYLLMLKPQANSAYLQNFHQQYFLSGNFSHDWALFTGLLSVAGGHTAISVYLHLLFIVVAIIALARKNIAGLLLLIIPVCALMIAAAMKQFTLLDRVSLFIMPILLLLIGYGFSVVFGAMRNNIMRAAIVVICLVSFGSYCGTTFSYPYKYEQLTDGLEKVQEQNIKGDDLYLYHSSVPAYIYYTQMHPDKDKWNMLSAANELYWYTNYDSLGSTLAAREKTAAYLFTNGSEQDFNVIDNALQTHLQATSLLSQKDIRVNIYKP